MSIGHVGEDMELILFLGWRHWRSKGHGATALIVASFTKQNLLASTRDCHPLSPNVLGVVDALAVLEIFCDIVDILSRLIVVQLTKIVAAYVLPVLDLIVTLGIGVCSLQSLCAGGGSPDWANQHAQSRSYMLLATYYGAPRR